MPKFKADRAYTMTDESGNLILSFAISRYDKRVAQMVVQETKTYKNQISIEIKELKRHRSLDQNAMLWALITKLCDSTCGSHSLTTMNEMYCIILEEANIESDFILAPKECAESLKKSFRAIRERGTRTVKTDKGEKEMIVYQTWIGSSKFNTKEMSDLIDSVLDKLADLGIYDAEIQSIMGELNRA